MIDGIFFEWGVGGEVETALRGDTGDGAGLLVALQDDVDLAEVVRGADDAAFVAVIAGEKPEAVSPWVVDDVVYVADCSLGKGVGDIPLHAAVGRSVDVNLIAGGVVEVLSPENIAAGNCCDVERSG